MTREEKIAMVNKMNAKNARPKSANKTTGRKKRLTEFSMPDNPMNMSYMEYEEHQKKMNNIANMADQYL